MKCIWDRAFFFFLNRWFNFWICLLKPRPISFIGNGLCLEGSMIWEGNVRLTFIGWFIRNLGYSYQRLKFWGKKLGNEVARSAHSCRSPPKEVMIRTRAKKDWLRRATLSAANKKEERLDDEARRRDPRGPAAQKTQQKLSHPLRR